MNDLFRISVIFLIFSGCIAVHSLTPCRDGTQIHKLLFPYPYLWTKYECKASEWVSVICSLESMGGKTANYAVDAPDVTECKNPP